MLIHPCLSVCHRNISKSILDRCSCTFVERVAIAQRLTQFWLVATRSWSRSVEICTNVRLLAYSTAETCVPVLVVVRFKQFPVSVRFRGYGYGYG